MREVRDKVKVRQEKIGGIRRRRRRKFWAALAILVILVLGLVQLYRSGWFNVKKIEVMGNKRLSDKQVVKISDVSKTTSLIGLPKGAIREKLLKNPWVKEAEISSSLLFRKVKIEVVERKPLAVILFKNPGDKEETFFVVDKDRFVVEKLENIDKVKLPLIRDVVIDQPVIGQKLDSSDSFCNAISCLSSLDSKLRTTITIVSAPSVDKLSLYTSEGTEILYGKATDLATKNFAIKKILSEEGSQVIFIDIRTASNPVIKRLEENP